MALPYIKYCKLYRFKEDLPRSASSSKKFNAPIIFTNKVNLDDYKYDHEVMGVEVRYEDIWPGTNIYVTSKMTDKDTGKVLFESTEKIPPPSKYGYDKWDWYKLRWWIPKTDNKLVGVKEVQVDVTATGGPGFDGSQQLNMTITEAPKLAALEIESTPPGAEVVINDVVQFATTPSSYIVSPGINKLTINLSGYISFSQTYDIDPAEIKKLTGDNKIILETAEPEPEPVPEEIVYGIMPVEPPEEPPPEEPEEPVPMMTLQSFFNELKTYYTDRMYLSKKEIIALGIKYGFDISGL